MLAVIETPKYSFVKRELADGRFKRTFFSPVPTPFNYGFIEGAKGGDGVPLDVIVLGRRLKRGTTLEIDVIGKVKFIDDSKEDDKYIASMDGRRHSRTIFLFFSFYTIAKSILNLLIHKKWTKNGYLGTVWFEEGVRDVEELI